MQGRDDVTEYLEELMGGANPAAVQFAEALVRRRHNVPSNVTIHKKKDEADVRCSHTSAPGGIPTRVYSAQAAILLFLR